jgi:hypothetical protein
MINGMNSGNKDALTYFFSKYRQDMNIVKELESVINGLNAYELSNVPLVEALKNMKEKAI